VFAFFEFSVVTQVTIVNQFPIDFPTLCNLNYFQTSYAKSFLQNISQIYNLPNVFDPQLIYNGSYNSLFELYTNLGKAGVIQFNLTDDQIKNLSFSTKATILDTCRFAGKPCSKNEFNWIFLPKYGNCFRFNAGYDFYGNRTEPKTVITTGVEGGLELELFVGLPAIIEMFTKGLGALVFVHSANTSLMSLSGVSIGTNAETNIVVSRLEVQKLSSPYSECDIVTSSDSSLYELIKSNGYDYRQSDCIIQCFQKTLIETCGCYDVTKISYFVKATPCRSLNDIDVNCTNQLKQAWTSSFIKEKCDPHCPIECESSQYLTSISSNYYPTVAYSKIISKSNIFDSEVNSYGSKGYSISLSQLILKVNVYFDSLSYTSITESPSQETISFVSNVGGLLGLFLGATVLSFLEFAEFLIICLQIIKKRNTKVLPRDEQH
jgi:hypothetical protein